MFTVKYVAVGCRGPREPIDRQSDTDPDAWKAIIFELPFGAPGDQVGEPPRVRYTCSEPSWFIRNKSEVLIGSPAARSRLLSNTILPLPSGDSAGKVSA